MKNQYNTCSNSKFVQVSKSQVPKKKEAQYHIKEGSPGALQERNQTILQRSERPTKRNLKHSIKREIEPPLKKKREIRNVLQKKKPDISCKEGIEAYPMIKEKNSSDLQRKVQCTIKNFYQKEIKNKQMTKRKKIKKILKKFLKETSKKRGRKNNEVEIK